MEFLLIFFLLILNGCFAMVEMALVSAKKFKLENLQKKGSTSAKIALELKENPTKLLSTVQIGITVISLLLGIYSNDNIAKYLKPLLDKIEFLKPYSERISVIIVIIIITYLTIFVGELMPKKLGLTFSEPIAVFLARPMKVIATIAFPFIWFLSKSNEFILKIFSINTNLDKKISEEEIKSIINESANYGEIRQIEKSIVNRIFELGDKRINAYLIHKSNIQYFNIDDSLEVVLKKINNNKHNIYPVCENNNVDEILGIVYLCDLFVPTVENKFNLSNYLKKPFFIHEKTYSYKLLEIIQQKDVEFAVVLNEYGLVEGIITVYDIVHSLIVGYLNDDKKEIAIVKRTENTWFVDGQYSLNEFIQFFNLQEQDDLEIVTVAGLCIHHFNKIPNLGDKFIIENIELEIVDKDKQRIDKILVTKIK